MLRSNRRIFFSLSKFNFRMDLRDRENLDLIHARLLALGIADLADLKMQDQQLNTTLYSECTEEARMQKSCIRTWAIVPLRMHVFNEIHGDEITVRLSGEVREGYMMSDFVSEINMRTENEEVVWKRNEERIDGITLTRKSFNHLDIEISINYPNSLLPVPSALGSKFLFADFINLFKIICEYIRSKNLSSNDDPSYFTPDDVLHKILYPNLPPNHPVSFASLLDVVRAQIKPPGPFKIPFKIDSKQTDSTKTEKVFEIMVQIPQVQPVAIDTNLLQFREEAQLKDEDIAKYAENLTEITNECAYLQKLVENPIGFMQSILLSPTGVAQIDSDGKIDYAQLTTSYDFYKQPWAVAAAAHVINEKRKNAEKQYI